MNLSGDGHRHFFSRLGALTNIWTILKFYTLLLIFKLVLAPILALASVKSSLMGVQTKLTRVILPLLSVIGSALADLSFLTGSENAKKHIIYAIIGTAIGFWAQKKTLVARVC